MNRLEIRLKELDTNLFGRLNETVKQVKLFLNEYKNNFPQYTDHSIHHTIEVFNIVDEILTDDEINNLNEDEIYILAMACYLHDIGMCIPEDKISIIADTDDLLHERELHPEVTREDFLRSIHHTLSAKFIRDEWVTLNIPSPKYADAIALVSEGHRVVDIGNPDIYKPMFFVKTGRSFVCIPYLAAILRIADELDITNVRTPSLLTKYYIPDNEKSLNEWNKHIANTIRNVAENYVRFEVECSNHSMLASLENQFNKIKNVLNYCQKVIKFISNTEGRKFSLKLEQVREEYIFINFNPKGIRYSFDVENVVNAFVGENLYNDRLTSLREVIQNAIDTCRYKQVINKDNYNPNINITVKNKFIKIEDNGLGMDEFIIKNFFSKLGSSYYEQPSVKKNYEAIGQFGVGVFSYFLMADYIDIETKTDHSETLHFRLDKDPKSYFHFFPKSLRKTSGTTITMHLKSEFEKFSTLTYINYLRSKFRFIEFPVTVSFNDSSFVLEPQSLYFEQLDELIKDNLKYTYKEEAKNIKTYTVDFDNERCQGSITLLYFKDFTFAPIFYMFNEAADSLKEDFNDSLVEISQKGVFITNHTRLSLMNTLCKLNLKQKFDIQINRNNFSDIDQLRDLFLEINTILINNFMSYVNKENEKDSLPQITYNFLSRLPYNVSKCLKNVSDNIYLSYVKNGSNIVTTWREFLELNLESFYLLINNNYPSHDFNGVQSFYKVNSNYDSGFHSYISLFKDFGYEEVVTFENNNYYTKLSKTKKNLHVDNFYEIRFTHTENIKFINVDFFFLANNDLDHYHIAQINYNHPIINRLYDVVKDSNSLTKSLAQEILEYITSFKYDKHGFSFKKLNALLSELKKFVSIQGKFSKKDFEY